MDETTVMVLRSIFQHKIQLHPMWNKESREALADLFNLDDEQLDALHKFGMWVSNHELEYALGMDL